MTQYFMSSGHELVNEIQPVVCGADKGLSQVQIYTGIQYVCIHLSNVECRLLYSFNTRLLRIWSRLLTGRDNLFYYATHQKKIGMGR